MLEGIESAFPRLRGATYHVTRPRDEIYNCIAWAAGVTDGWWWPVGAGKTYWPTGIQRTVTIEAFREALATLGYVVCSGEELEPGFEKIALFVNAQLVPKHAARQKLDGRWTSKLGMMEDIDHALHDLEGEAYGEVGLLMKRGVPAAHPPG